MQHHSIPKSSDTSSMGSISEGGEESLCHIMSGLPMHREGENLHRVGGIPYYHFIVSQLTRDGTIMVDSKKRQVKDLCYRSTIIFSANKSSSVKSIFILYFLLVWVQVHKKERQVKVWDDQTESLEKAGGTKSN